MAGAVKMTLPSADDLFSTQDERDNARRERVQDIPLDLIDDFPDHPFHIRQDEAMAAMVESVRVSGVLTPAVARLKEDGTRSVSQNGERPSEARERYELVSGHRRKFAALQAGLETLPVIVREMTHDEAVVLMVDANLQREAVLPSEKAFSYKMKMEALSRQGQRTDLTSPPVEGKLKKRCESADIVGEKSGDSREQVRRFIRLTSLVPALLQLVDDGKIAFRPAVELSYLQENEQAALLEAMQAQDATPSLAQAIKMKQFSQEGKLTPEVILSVMMEEKGNQKEKITFSTDKFKSYFKPGTPVQTMEQTIIKALDLYRQRQREKKREGPGL